VDELALAYRHPVAIDRDLHPAGKDEVNCSFSGPCTYAEREIAKLRAKEEESRATAVED